MKRVGPSGSSGPGIRSRTSPGTLLVTVGGQLIGESLLLSSLAALDGPPGGFELTCGVRTQSGGRNLAQDKKANHQARANHRMSLSERWMGRISPIVAQCTPERPDHCGGKGKKGVAGLCEAGRVRAGVADPGYKNSRRKAWAHERFDSERSRSIMSVSRSPIGTVLVLITGLFAGWCLASFRPAPLHASAGDRSGEAIVATGPVIVRWDESAKSAVPDRRSLLSRLQGGTVAGDGPELPANDRKRTVDRTVQRGRGKPGRRLQA